MQTETPSPKWLSVFIKSENTEVQWLPGLTWDRLSPPPKSHSLAAVLLLLLLALYAPRLDVIHTLAASCTRSEVA